MKNKISILIVSILLCAFVTSCGLGNKVPKSGDWTAKTDFGSVVFTVNPDGTEITKAVFNFTNFQCGPGSVSGSMGLEFSEGQKIENNKFSIKFDDNVQLGVPDPLNPVPPMSNVRTILINGEIKSDGLHASGTWESSFNQKSCAKGEWTALPN